MKAKSLQKSPLEGHRRIPQDYQNFDHCFQYHQILNRSRFILYLLDGREDVLGKF